MNNLKVQVFADGADINQMKQAYQNKEVDGFTTNPSLMAKAGVKDYKQFAKEVVEAIPDASISFEVFGDDMETMEKEAEIIQQFGENIFVKIPIVNTKGETMLPLIKKLSAKGVKLNVTAVYTIEQVKDITEAVTEGVETYVSVFAGRIADTGVDPLPLMKEAVEVTHSKKGVQLLWASCRELFNVVQADEIGADIITCPSDVVKKVPNIGRDINELSVDTVKGFSKDIQSSGLSIL
ncbi:MULTISPECIES: transaldolase [Staphylococcus]|uniref:Transaldolase n=3 Tax=Staphylococcus chromogenes TaxID=46126 RepID=A0AAE5SYI1_STACR|nr:MULTISPECIES: transaldolase [Staphylococcus]KDP13106.1 translaldolase [Staphylococcus chromogenes MU 970]MBP0045556.1 transaldolase [Staphylococcus chromogenes]MBV5137890.1 transaldolase [Staphylococcus chromogenes]MBV5190733.1 transaldolase [Staphylococcus chromogenes]MBW3132418.1 transaldolase [Staphylococcus chromogenes]